MPARACFERSLSAQHLDDVGKPSRPTAASHRSRRSAKGCSTNAGRLSSGRGGDDMTSKFSAQCACGKIKFEVETDLSFVANCHCRDCKRASGGEMATFFGVPEA